MQRLLYRCGILEIHAEEKNDKAAILARVTEIGVRKAAAKALPYDAG